MIRQSDKPIVKWAQEIKTVITLFKAEQWSTEPETDIGNELEKARLQIINALGAAIKLDVFRVIGSASLRLIEKIEPFNWNDFCTLLLEKHRRYGAHPLRVFGTIGVIIRIYSKFERYRNIKDDPSAILTDEGPMDTLHDILGYCVLGYLLCEENQS